MVARSRRVFPACGALILAGVLLQGRAKADYISTDTNLPSPDYQSTNTVSYNTSGGVFTVNSFFDVFTEVSITGGKVDPPPPGNSRIDSFFDVFTELSLTLPNSQTVTADAGASGQLSLLNTTTLGVTSPLTFNTEMLQMDLSSGLPGAIMIRESPTLASTGQTTMTAVGGGQFEITSFFDIFTELSIDGGQTWTPASGSLHVGGTLPEPTSIALCGAAAMFLAGRRRRA